MKFVDFSDLYSLPNGTMFRTITRGEFGPGLLVKLRSVAPETPAGEYYPFRAIEFDDVLNSDRIVESIHDGEVTPSGRFAVFDDADLARIAEVIAASRLLTPLGGESGPVGETRRDIP